jgi:alanine-glyoxylate transaminase/serine-glyoxylate transaminase/serine-pyruvate transaminase
MALPAELNPTPRILMGPGPSDAHPAVTRAMATPLIGHLDPQFIGIMNSVRSMLQQIFRTENEMTFAVSAPGSAGMETCLVNLLEPGDEALICIHGVFGGRMADVAERCGAVVHRVEAEWGKHIDPSQVKDALESCSPKLVAIVHAETSTGVLQPLEEISRLTHDAGALLVADMVTSLGGVDVRIDDWKIDAVYSGTQKCLSAPPGLSPVSFNDRAMDVVRNRKQKVQSWFLDLNLVGSYVTGDKRAYHHTAPISSIYALHTALRLVLEEGLEARFKRHMKNHELLRDGLESIGIGFIVDPAYRLPQLNTVSIPDGIDDATVRSRLLNDYNIEIGAGLGAFAGKAWRIGLMGCSSSPNHVNMLLRALQEIMD